MTIEWKSVCSVGCDWPGCGRWEHDVPFEDSDGPNFDGTEAGIEFWREVSVTVDATWWSVGPIEPREPLMVRRFYHACEGHAWRSQDGWAAALKADAERRWKS